MKQSITFTGIILLLFTAIAAYPIGRMGGGFSSGGRSFGGSRSFSSPSRSYSAPQSSGSFFGGSRASKSPATITRPSAAPRIESRSSTQAPSSRHETIVHEHVYHHDDSPSLLNYFMFWHLAQPPQPTVIVNDAAAPAATAQQPAAAAVTQETHGFFYYFVILLLLGSLGYAMYRWIWSVK